MIRIPVLASDLILLLDKLYPSLPPEPSDSPAELWMKAGERRLVNHLLSVSNIREQEEAREPINLSVDVSSEAPLKQGKLPKTTAGFFEDTVDDERIYLH